MDHLEIDWRFHKSEPILDFLGTLERYRVQLSISVTTATLNFENSFGIATKSTFFFVAKSSEIGQARANFVKAHLYCLSIT